MASLGPDDELEEEPDDPPEDDVPDEAPLEELSVASSPPLEPPPLELEPDEPLLVPPSVSKPLPSVGPHDVMAKGVAPVTKAREIDQKKSGGAFKETSDPIVSEKSQPRGAGPTRPRAGG